MGKYLGRLADIRRIQDLIVERAERSHVPVVENANAERAIDAVIDLLLDLAEAGGRAVLP